LLLLFGLSVQQDRLSKNFDDIFGEVVCATEKKGMFIFPEVAVRRVGICAIELGGRQVQDVL